MQAPVGLREAGQERLPCQPRTSFPFKAAAALNSLHRAVVEWATLPCVLGGTAPECLAVLQPLSICMSCGSDEADKAHVEQ